MFPRPLDKTLITDFFGGVAQVELVAEETLSPSSAGAEILEQPSNPHNQTIDENLHYSIPATTKLRSNYSDSFSYLRAWGGLAFIGVLVAFVGTRTK